MSASRLKITEIFHSLQGEADTAGIPTVFVRLTGCPLRCQYCDTAYAFHGRASGGSRRRSSSGCASSPLLTYASRAGSRSRSRRACALLTLLCDAGLRVSLETSGAMPLAGVDARVKRVVDVKTPGSGEEGRNLYPELASLRAQDLVKFVICGRADYEWSRGKLAELGIAAAMHGAVLTEP